MNDLMNEMEKDIGDMLGPASELDPLESPTLKKVNFNSSVEKELPADHSMAEARLETSIPTVPALPNKKTCESLDYTPSEQGIIDSLGLLDGGGSVLDNISETDVMYSTVEKEILKELCGELSLPQSARDSVVEGSVTGDHRVVEGIAAGDHRVVEGTAAGDHVGDAVVRAADAGGALGAACADGIEAKAGEQHHSDTAAERGTITTLADPSSEHLQSLEEVSAMGMTQLLAVDTDGKPASIEATLHRSQDVGQDLTTLSTTTLLADHLDVDEREAETGAGTGAVAGQLHSSETIVAAVMQEESKPAESDVVVLLAPGPSQEELQAQAGAEKEAAAEAKSNSVMERARKLEERLAGALAGSNVIEARLEEALKSSKEKPGLVKDAESSEATPSAATGPAATGPAAAGPAASSAAGPSSSPPGSKDAPSEPSRGLAHTAVPGVLQPPSIPPLERPSQGHGSVGTHQSAWGEGDATPGAAVQPTKVQTAKEIQEEYLEELKKQQEAEDVERAKKEEDRKLKAGFAARGKVLDEEIEDDQDPTVSGISTLLREALRLLVPNTWDSEDEAKQGRKHPDVHRLAGCWSVLEEDLQAFTATEVQRADIQLQQNDESASAAIEAKARDLEAKLQQRAKAAEAKLDTVAAQRHRSLAWNVVNLAEAAKDKRRAGHRAKATLAKRRAKGRKEAVRRALGPDPSSAAGASIVIPDAAAFSEMSPAEALSEIAEATRNCYRALQVVALRPPETVLEGALPQRPDDNDTSPAQAAWLSNTIGGSLNSGGSDTTATNLVAASEAAMMSLRSSLQALRQRLQAQREEVTQVDPALDAVATDMDRLSKDQKREKIMFDSQQEYDWQRAIGNRVTEQARRRNAYNTDSLERVGKVLKRRWHRQRERDKARTMGQLLALLRSIDEAETNIERIRQEHLEKAAADADRLEEERRRMQEQTQVLLKAALVIRQEKLRMSQASATANLKDKRKLMLQSLRMIRRLNEDMKNFPVLAEFKQKHSVLLYSLRMLEARLKNECPGSTDADIHEGPIETTAEQELQLHESEEAFEEQLQSEIDALRINHRARSERAMAREAARCRQMVEAELLPGLIAARSALQAADDTATLPDLAVGLLRPLAVASARLGVEAFRQAMVVKGEGEPAAFGPRQKRLDGAIDATMKTLEEIQPLFATGQRLSVAPSAEMARNRDWVSTLTKAEQRWSSFCKAHPNVHIDDEHDTPRGEQKVNVTMIIDTSFVIDDLEEEMGTPRGMVSPTTTGAKEGASNSRSMKKGAAGGLGAANTTLTNFRPGTSSGQKPSGPPPPPPPPSKGLQRPPSAGGTGPPKGGLKPQLSGAWATPAGGTTDSKGAALLAQLDELTKTMDDALGKSGPFSRKAGSASANAPPELSPPSRPGRAKAGWS